MTCRSFLVALLALTPSAALCDESIRCDGGIVSVGDSKLDLLGKCGEPAFRESRIEEQAVIARTDRPRAAAGDRESVAVERWTYDFGPQRFVGIVSMRLGRLTFVEHGDRGRVQDPTGRARAVIPRAVCDPGGFHEGERAWDVLGRCGEPATRERGERTRSLSTSVGGGRRGDAASGEIRREVMASTTVSVERWSYDFGPGTLVRNLELVDGVVVSVETGGHGYSPP